MVTPFFGVLFFDKQWLPPCFGALVFALLPLGFKAFILTKFFATNLLLCSPTCVS